MAKGTIMYTLVNYFDVWGNEEDGWEVNDCCVEREHIPFHADVKDEEILDFLVENKFLITSDPNRVGIRDDGSNLEVYEQGTEMPLFGLVLEM